MASKLDIFLETIDPRRNLDQLWARADAGLNSFKVGEAVATDYWEFQRFLASFFCHMENYMLRLNPPREPDYDFDAGRCHHLLQEELGEQAYQVAFDRARTGVDGGLYGVLKMVAELMVQEYAGNEIAARVSKFWNDLSLDEKLEVPQEYVRKHGHLLPSEITEGVAAKVLVNFRKVLEEHPRVIARLRRVGR
jgi:hypothetical protein